MQLLTDTTIRSVALLTLAIVPFASAHGAAPLPEKDRGATVAGVVVDSDGRAIAGAALELRGAATTVRGVSGADGKFKLTFAEDFKHLLNLFVRTRDGRQAARVALLKLPERKTWRALRVELKPARRVEVEVKDAEGKPISEARAGVLSELIAVAQARTDRLGRATLSVPADCPVEQVYAWKSGRGFDYRSYVDSYRGENRKAPPLPKGAISLRLKGARTVRVRALDTTGIPIAKMPMYVWYFNKPGETTDLNLSGAVEEFLSITDMKGIATFDWLPTWHTQELTFWPRSDEYVHLRLNVSPKSAEQTATLTLPRLEPLRGRVTYADGKPAAGIKIRVSGRGYQIDSHHDETRTGPDGKYELLVAPNLIYLVIVADERWAAAPQTGFAVLPGIPTPDKDFTLRPTTRVYGRVTLGQQKKALAGQNLFLGQHGADLSSLPDVKLPNPEKSRSSVRPSLAFWQTTDKDGRFEFRVGPGKFQLAGVHQVKRVDLTITNQAEIEINLHSPREAKGRLKGLVVSGSPPRPVAQARITSVYKARASGYPFATRCDAQGRFDVERLRHPVVLLARSADGKRAGIAEIGSDDDEVKIAIAPIAAARGCLVDGETAEPLAGRKIQCGIRVPLTQAKNPPFVNAFGDTAITDAGGRFVLKGLVAGLKYELTVHDTKDGSRYATATFIPKAGETVRLDDVRLRPTQRPATLAEQRRAAFTAKGTPVERFEAARRDARLTQQRVLVVFAAPEDGATHQLFALTHEYIGPLDAALEDYRLVWIAADADRMAAAQALARKLGAKLHAGAAPLLVIADEQGKSIATLATGTLEKEGTLDGAGIRPFLLKAAPARLDVQKMLDDALARARKEKRRVLVQETGPRCGPCLRLSRFLDAHRAVWEKDYLWVKVDRRWANAEQVMKRFRKGDARGIPWMVILDADAKVLATSDDKEGQNIGFPNTAASSAHFTSMLRGTAQRMTPAEIARLADALKAAGSP